MEIRVLRYFITVMQVGNITQAARQLHVSQPALSRQIMDLEAEIGSPLFIRGHRQLQPTQSAYYLYQQAKEIVGITDKTLGRLQSHDVVSGTLDIGAGESQAVEPVMAAVANILQEYSGVLVNLHSGDADSIFTRLDTGLLEFGIVMGHYNLRKYNTLPLPGKNRWGVIMKSTDPLAKKQFVVPTDLVDRPLLTSVQTRQQDTFRNWAGEFLNQFHFVGNYNLIYNAYLLVKTSSCLAFTYDHLLNAADIDGLAFRPLKGMAPDENTLIWQKNQALPNVGQLFLDKLHEQLQKGAAK